MLFDISLRQFYLYSHKYWTFKFQVEIWNGNFIWSCGSFKTIIEPAFLRRTFLRYLLDITLNSFTLF